MQLSAKRNARKQPQQGASSVKERKVKHSSEDNLFKHRM